MDEVVSMTDGTIVSLAGKEIGMESGSHPPMKGVYSTYATVWIRDGRGWFYYYTHLKEIDSNLKLGGRVEMGQRIGLLGKESDSGGWAHLHVEIKAIQPSGKWGTQAGYAFMMEAYRRQHDPALIAVAQPSQRAKTGESVRLDATRSWSKHKISRWRWILADGRELEGSSVQTMYHRPGQHSTLLEMTDHKGNRAYDVAVVRVVDATTGLGGPGPHAAFHPSLKIQPGSPITFKVRTRGAMVGREIWDFGDGSPPAYVVSNLDPASRAPEGYASVVHRYGHAGLYFPTVRRTDENGNVGIARLIVEVAP